MKRKLFFIGLFLVINSFLFSEISVINKNGIMIKETGIILMYGNAPFTYPGIKTETGKSFTLKFCNKIIEKKILKNIGHKVVITGYLENENLPLDENIRRFQELKDGFFVVKKIKVIR